MFKEFLDQQGSNLAGQPLWRLVWSENAMELRTGEFNEWHGDLFLRTVRDTRWVRKYSYIKDRWILERWFPPELVFTPELPDSGQGSYEPVFVYEDKNGHELPVTIKTLEYIIGSANRPRPSAAARELELLNQQKEVESREVEEFKDQIDSSVISSQLHSKEAIIVP